MKTTPVLLFLAIIASPTATAWADGVRDARDEIAEAVDKARDEGGSCRRAVVEDLRDIRKDLRDAGRRDMRRARKKLRRLKEDADEECPRGVVKHIRRAIRDIEDELDSDRDDRDEDEDDDRDRRRRRKKHRDRHREKRIECWTNNDPGCKHTKNGHPPMDRAAFNSFMQAIRASKPHVFPMKDLVRSQIANRYLTSLQLATLLDEFKPHVFPMKDVVELCAPHLVDPQNGGVATAKFRPHVHPMRDAAKMINAQSGD